MVHQVTVNANERMVVCVTTPYKDTRICFFRSDRICSSLVVTLCALGVIWYAIYQGDEGVTGRTS